jgi:hypothetical protein
MCEHKSIFDELAEVIPNFKPKKTIREALIDEGIIAKKNGRIVNLRAGVNFYLLGIGVTAADPNKKMEPSDEYVIVKVMLTMNKIYHLKKNQTNYVTGEKVDEEQENQICFHEKGHQELSGRIIPPDGFEFRENLDSSIKTEQQLKIWLKKVRADWNQEFRKIYYRARDLYHEKYGDDGSPWTFDKETDAMESVRHGRMIF